MSDYDRPINPKKSFHRTDDVHDAYIRGEIQGPYPGAASRPIFGSKENPTYFQALASPAQGAEGASPIMTLPTDSAERKGYPLYRGCLKYFPAALAGVSRISKAGNDKHNPGEEMHHARGKSSDHGDCILRHLIDVTDLIAARERTIAGPNGEVLVSREDVLNEVNQLAWRVLAFSQELHESLGAPLAPGAKIKS